MAANTKPIYPLTPVIGMSTIATANTAKDGTGTVVTLFTAGTDGGRVDKIKVRPTGTSVQTVLRVFLNNGLTNATPANNTLYMERTIPAYTLSETTEQLDIAVQLDVALPAGWKVNCAIGTTVASALALTCEGGNY